MTIADVRPLTAFLRKELLIVLRMRRSWLLLAIVCALATAATVDWVLAKGGQAKAGSVAMTIASKELVFRHFCVLFAAVIIWVPVVTAVSVIQELDRETIEMIVLTHTKRWHFLLGKFISGAAYAILLCIGYTGILASVYFGLGVNIETVAAGIGLLLLTAGTLAAIGVGCSCAASTSSRAVFFGSVGATIVAGGPVWIGSILLRYLQHPFGVVLRQRAPYLFPTYCFFDLLENPSARGVSSSYVVCAELQCGLAGIFMLFAYLMLARRWRHPRAHAAPIAARARTPRPSRRMRARVKQAFRPVRHGANAIAHVELRINSALWGRTGRRIFFAVLFLCSALSAVACLLSRGSQTPFRDTFTAWLCIGAIFSPLAVPAYSVAVFSREIENGMLDELRMGRFSAFQILRGKAYAIAWLCLLVTMGYSVSIAVWLLYNAALGAHQDPVTMIRMQVIASGTLLLFMAVAISLSLATSVIIRRTSIALVCTYGAMLFLGACMPWVARPIIGYFPAASAYAARTGDGAYHLLFLDPPWALAGVLGETMWSAEYVSLKAYDVCISILACIALVLGAIGALIYRSRVLKTG